MCVCCVCGGGGGGMCVCIVLCVLGGMCVCCGRMIYSRIDTPTHLGWAGTP